MADKIIPESDLNEGKTKRAAETLGGDDAPPLFDSAGVVEPSAPTEGATMPETPSPVKRGRGRPRKEGGDQTVKLKAKPKKKTPEQAEAEGMASAQIIVAGLDMMRKAISAGEAPDALELRNATIEAWQTYLAENGWEVPAWVQVAVISTAYVAPAFTTQTGKGRMAGLWAKAKAWWALRHGA